MVTLPDSNIQWETMDPSPPFSLGRRFKRVVRSFRGRSSLTREKDTSETVLKVPDANDTLEPPVSSPVADPSPSPITEPALTNKNTNLEAVT